MPFLVLNKSDNKHVSTADTAQELATPLPADKQSVFVATFDPQAQQWDPAASKVIAKPAASVSSDEALRLSLTAVPIGVGFATQLQRDQAMILLLKKLGPF